MLERSWLHKEIKQNALMLMSAVYGLNASLHPVTPDTWSNVAEMMMEMRRGPQGNEVVNVRQELDSLK
jgi:hypothetical protein